MSELIQNNNNRNVIRWKLLTGASALALTVNVVSSGAANAEDADRPTVWIELGGQMEQVQGLSAPFTAPFMSISPTPDIYKGFPFTGSQDAARFSFGEEATFSIQPAGSDWLFSAGVRYGRSKATRHSHRQQSAPFPYTYVRVVFGQIVSNAPRTADFGDVLADAQTSNSEQHLVLDFAAGKDVGLGLFGRQGMSTVSAGVRFASFTTHSTAAISGRPAINAHVAQYSKYYGLIQRSKAVASFHRYAVTGHADRSFRGVGPTLSWNASAALTGDEDDGELTFDWGVDGALLFGRQKARVDHTTKGYLGSQRVLSTLFIRPYAQTYQRSNHSTRSRSVVVPNIGGFAGISLKWPNAKMSLGYREDFFIGAMDTGIDTADKSNVGFHGPFATISIGFGG